MLWNQPTAVRSTRTGVGRESCVQKQTGMEGLDAKGCRVKRRRANSWSIETGRGMCSRGGKRTADCDRRQLRRNVSLIRGNRGNQPLNGFSTQTNSPVTVEATILKLMITLLDHDTDIRLLRNHVHVIRMMDMWTQASVGLVVTGCVLMLKRALATVGTYRGCNRRQQN